MGCKLLPRRAPTDLAGYLEALSRPVFDAGISWRVIDSKWEGIRDAFAETVADLKRQFRFIGDSGAYRFLYLVDQPVPPHREWFAATRATRGRRHDGAGAAKQRNKTGA